jgi:hypothetical protein
LKSFNGFSGVTGRIVCEGDDCGAVMSRPCGVEASDLIGLCSVLEELRSHLLAFCESLSEPGESESPECCDAGLCMRS